MLLLLESFVRGHGSIEDLRHQLGDGPVLLPRPYTETFRRGPVQGHADVVPLIDGNRILSRHLPKTEIIETLAIETRAPHRHHADEASYVTPSNGANRSLVLMAGQKGIIPNDYGRYVPTMVALAA